jgi:DNA repair ATPase RecN
MLGRHAGRQSAKTCVNGTELVQLESEIKQMRYYDQEYVDKWYRLHECKGKLAHIQEKVTRLVQQTGVEKKIIQKLESKQNSVDTSMGKFEEMLETLIKIEAEQAREIAFLQKCVKSQTNTHNRKH